MRTATACRRWGANATYSGEDELLSYGTRSYTYSAGQLTSMTESATTTYDYSMWSGERLERGILMELHTYTVTHEDGSMEIRVSPKTHAALVSTGALLAALVMLASPLWILEPMFLLYVAPFAAVSALVWNRYFDQRWELVSIGEELVRYEAHVAGLLIHRKSDRTENRKELKRVVHARDVLGVTSLALDRGKDKTLFGLFTLRLTKSQLYEIAKILSNELAIPCEVLSVDEFGRWPDQ